MITIPKICVSRPQCICLIKLVNIFDCVKVKSVFFKSDGLITARCTLFENGNGNPAGVKSVKRAGTGRAE